MMESRKNAQKVMIVGAGVCGLTVGVKLSGKGTEVIVIEREPQVGGLGRSFCYGDFTFDIGPHRFYTTNSRVMSLLKEIIGDESITIRRKSKVWMFNRYYDWPLNMRCLLNIPVGVAFRVVWDMFLHLLPHYRKFSKTFSDYIIGMYGRTLFETFFKQYTEKFLGLPAAKIHSDWASTGIDRAIIDKRIRVRNILDVFKMVVLPTPFETTFLYPRKGIDIFAHRLGEKIKDSGGKVFAGTRLLKMEIRNRRIVSVESDKSVFEPDIVVWTGNLLDLCRLLDFSEPMLKYRSLVLYNIETKSSLKLPWQWCYYPAESIIFSRITLPGEFSSDVVRDGETGICVEITCNEGDEVWQSPQGLRKQVIEGLIGVGVLKSETQIDSIHIERVRDAYPVYDRMYREELDALKEKFSKIENLIITGRTGTFWYNNMDHSIEAGLEVYEICMKQGNKTRWVSGS